MVRGISSDVPWVPMSVSIGSSFTGDTIISTSSEAMALPWLSLTVKVNVSVPLKSCTDPNVTSKPSMDTVTFTVPDTVKTKPSSSISSTKPLKSSTRIPSSANVKLSGNSIVGSSFTGVTVNVNTVLSVYSPSVTDTLIWTSPLKSPAGVSVNWSPVTSADTLFGCSLTALNVKLSPSTSNASSIMVRGISSDVPWVPISVSIGSSFTESIKTLIVWVTTPPKPSSACKVKIIASVVL